MNCTCTFLAMDLSGPNEPLADMQALAQDCVASLPAPAPLRACLLRRIHACLGGAFFVLDNFIRLSGPACGVPGVLLEMCRL